MQKVICGEAYRELKKLQSNSIHSCVTSPPYYSPTKGLRDYNVAKIEWPDGWIGHLGKEPSPDMYADHLCMIFKELHRVIRSDGTLILNLGDSHAGSGCGSSGVNACIKNQSERQGHSGGSAVLPESFKQTDLFLIPYRVAEALRKSGWYLKPMFPWIKHNGSPGSYKNRPVCIIEWIIILTKSNDNYYDYIAVLQKASSSYLKDKRPKGVLRQRVNKNTKYDRTISQYKGGGLNKQDQLGSTYVGFNSRWKESVKSDMRLLRESDFFLKSFEGIFLNTEQESLALLLNTKSYKESHFAVFPPELPLYCILFATSEYGVCKFCGTSRYRAFYKDEDANYITTGFVPGCTCQTFFTRLPVPYDPSFWNISIEILQQHYNEFEVIPATVIDPFGGSHSTGSACTETNRDYIGIELNPDYCKLSETR